MPKVDGSVIISTNIDVSQAEKDLAKLKGEIKKTESEIEEMEVSRKSAKEKSVFSAEELFKEELKLEEMKKTLQDIQATAKDTSFSQSARAEVQAGALVQKEDIKEQQSRVDALRSEYNEVHSAVKRYDEQLESARRKLELQQEEAGALLRDINSVSKASLKLAEAQKKAEKSAQQFSRRLSGVIRSALVFTVITQALAKLREWFGGVLKANEESRKAIARLKGALLTLVQPLVDKIIPAFTEFVNLLTALISKMAQIVFPLFGISIKDAAESAEALFEEQQALDGVASSAKNAKGALAGFDEINKLSSNTNNDTVAPDFSAVTDESWIDTVLGDVSEKVTAALLLGGIAMVALGASLGSLGLVLAGLSLLGASITIGDNYGTFAEWAAKLGLDSVTGYVETALLLGGIALVAIGAATANLTTVIAGLGLLGMGVVYSDGNQELESWVKALGLDSVNQFISTAILLGGIALVALGAIFGKIGMILAGLGLVGASVAYSDESTKQSWADALGLNSVFDYVTAAIQLAGIALIAIGARLGSLALVIAGGVILGLGIAADAIGQETLAAWWDVLKLTTVQQWVGVALTLVGIALIAIGACMGNFVMIAAGALSLGVGTITNASEGNLKSWVTTLGLEKVAGWVTAALLLVGIALIVFGIFTANIMMVIAGAGMLGAGISVGVTSGTFSNWIDAILKALTDFKNKALEIINEVWEGFTGLFGDIKKYNPNFTGYGPDYSWMFSGSVSAPGLATGAVIPPNREFMAVLGDQTSGNNIEAPEDLIRKIVREESGGANTELLQAILEAIKAGRVMKVDKRVLAETAVDGINDMTKQAGKSVLLV